MIEAGLTDTVVQAPEAISAIGTSIASSSGAAGLLWLLLRGKFESISLLWKKYDELADKVSQNRNDSMREMSENRLQDAKEYATRAELTTALGKLETHIDQRFNSLEAQIKAIKRK